MITHEFLMDYIDKFDCAGMVKEDPVRALRRIVELHQPDHSGLCEYCTCKDCSHMVSYPCRTIQHIEYELIHG